MTADQREADAYAGSDRATLARGAVVGLMGRVGGRALHLAVQVFLARSFGPATFGIYALGWTILRMAELLGCLGLDRATIRFGAAYWNKDAAGLRWVVTQSVGLALCAAVVQAVALLALADWLAATVFRASGLGSVLRQIAVAIVPAVLLTVVAAATTVSQRMVASTLTQKVLQPVLELMLVFVLIVLLRGGVTEAVTAITLSMFASLLAATYALGRVIPGGLRGPVNREVSRATLLSFALPASLAGTFSIATLWIDRLLIGMYMMPTAVGVYHVASQLAMLLVIILASFNAVFAPMIARLYRSQERSRVDELYKISTKWLLYLTTPFALVMVLEPRAVVVAVFGEAYAGAAAPLAILGTAQLINVGTGAVGHLLIMTGRQGLWLRISASMLAANVVLNMILVPRLGVLGAAVGTAASVAGLFLTGLAVVRGQLGLWPYDRRLRKWGLATGAAALVLVAVRQAELSDGVTRLAVSMVAVVCVFGGVLLGVGLDPEDRNVVDYVLRRRESP